MSIAGCIILGKLLHFYVLCTINVEMMYTVQDGYDGYDYTIQMERLGQNRRFLKNNCFIYVSKWPKNLFLSN